VLSSGKGARQVVRTTIAGRTSVYDLTIEPLRDAAGTIVGITCASLDIAGQPGREPTDAETNGTPPSEKKGDNP
jgi:hypothetical protein